MLSSNSFKSDLPSFGLSSLFNRLDSSISDSKKIDEEHIGKLLWRSVCWRMGIKKFFPDQASLCEYTWEVVVMITGKGRSSPDIWLKAPNQDTDTEDMIFTIWYKKAMKQTEINAQQHYSPAFSAKKVYYASYISSKYKNSYTHQTINIWFYYGFPGLHNRKNLELCWYLLPVIK